MKTRIKELRARYDMTQDDLAAIHRRFARRPSSVLALLGSRGLLKE